MTELHQDHSPNPSDKLNSAFLILVVWLSYLRESRLQTPPETRTLRYLILFVCLVLVALMLAVVGAPEEISRVWQAWRGVP